MAPSLLAADFSRLGEEARRLEAAGADWIHLDVMDGHFVPNLTFGPAVVRAVRRHTGLPLDVHLMVERPELFVADFVAAGASYVTVHVEAARDVGACLRAIRAAGAGAGLTLRPGTPVERLLGHINEIDLALIMTVEPGSGGQAFRPEQAAKLGRVLDARGGRDFLVGVDGGITADTAAQVARADVLVAGSFVFGGDPRARIERLRDACK